MILIPAFTNKDTEQLGCGSIYEQGKIPEI
jgi:hypothetical protein